jgi:hypothetical protein
MMIRSFAAFVLGAALVLSAQAGDPAPRLAPVDHGAKDASFLRFRNHLNTIIARKDAGALLTIITPDIKNSFGGDDGAANFRKIWKPADPASPVWPVLKLVVAMGGSFENKKTFVAPYTFSAFPDGHDGFETVVVTAKDTAMRAKPKADAEIVRKLDHDILTLKGGAPKLQHEAGPDDWLEVSDAAGKHGFVLHRDVRSPIDFRAVFEKRNRRWRMTDLIAGD